MLLLTALYTGLLFTTYVIYCSLPLDGLVRFSNKPTYNYFQEGDKETAISDPQWISKFTKHDGFERTGQQTVPLAKKVTCDVVPCLYDSVTSSGLSDVVSGDFVGSKRCSEVLELEWDGIDLVMDEGFEAIKLCKEEEV